MVVNKSIKFKETLAIKGLFLNHLNRKEESYECVKKGLKQNINSYICNLL